VELSGRLSLAVDTMSEYQLLPPESRIAEEANARGKASGYAHVGTILWNEEERVVWHIRRHPGKSRNNHRLILRVKVGTNFPGES
jgi:hypothetical protein